MRKFKLLGFAAMCVLVLAVICFAPYVNGVFGAEKTINDLTSTQFSQYIQEMESWLAGVKNFQTQASAERSRNAAIGLSGADLTKANDRLTRMQAQWSAVMPTPTRVYEEGLTWVDGTACTLTLSGANALPVSASSATGSVVITPQTSGALTRVKYVITETVADNFGTAINIGNTSTIATNAAWAWDKYSRRGDASPLTGTSTSTEYDAIAEGEGTYRVQVYSNTYPNGAVGNVSTSAVCEGE